MEIFSLSLLEALPKFEILPRSLFNVLYFATAEIESLFSSKGVLRHGSDRGMRTGTQLVFLLL